MTRPLGFETAAHAAALLIIVLIPCGCGSDNAETVVATKTALSFSKTLDSKPAESADALVVWDVSSGQPDYAYVWGRSEVQTTSFEIDLRSRPPADAMNSYGLGVGHVVIARRSAGLSDGRVSDEDTLFEELIGASEKQAIIYADHDAANAAIDAMRGTASAEQIQELEEFWLFDFPPGYSCGDARDAEPGETFDTFVPIECRALDVRLGDVEQFDFPNWT